MAISWNLHPPVLRAMGMKRKLRLGWWARPGMRGLRRMHRVRGTRLDVFGYTHVRRLERELIREYRGVVAEIIAGLSEDTFDDAVAIARLPDMVRGYEEVKIASVERYRAELRPRLARLSAPALTPER